MEVLLIIFYDSGAEGQLYNYILNTTSSEYKVFQIDASGKGEILATITDAPSAYIHSMFSTENYVILIIWQADLGKNKTVTNVVDNIKDWNPNRDSLFCKNSFLTCR